MEIAIVGVRLEQVTVAWIVLVYIATRNILLVSYILQILILWSVLFLLMYNNISCRYRVKDSVEHKYDLSLIKEKNLITWADSKERI